MQFFHSSVANILTVTCAIFFGVDAQYASTNGVNFIVNGKSFTYAGTNVYDAALRSASYASDTVKAVQAAGYTVLRSWAFTEKDPAMNLNYGVYFQSWSAGTPTFNLDPTTGIGVLDALVTAAEGAGVKLILTLTNNWQDYGGMDIYTNNAVNPGANHDLFYTDPKIATYYQNYVEAVVSRYNNSEAIFAWELANEARCSSQSSNPQSANCNPSVITAWADQMSTFIKSIDDKHMVTTGCEGLFNRPETAGSVYEYDGGAGQDFDALLKLQNIDFGTSHIYAGGQGSPSYITPDWGNQWLLDHDASGIAANKPVIQEEYGVSATYNRQQVYDQWHKTVLSSKSINGDMTWMSLPVDETACPASSNDVYIICPNDPDYAELVPGWSQQMSNKAGGTGN